ncbi:MAG: DUF72 domain-containing protein [Sedimentisphaerales bacterium]|nr:DUF72 domain-containing protein [Sedimentisphaerales bacterium]
MKIYVGCSGWSYGDWAGRFYPKDLPTSRWFEYYSRQFNTVELNNTFYHMPRPTTVARWLAQAPAGFLYAVKAHRSITHLRRLRSVDQQVETFWQVISGLDRRLGPVLYQLPPGLHLDLALLEGLLQCIPQGQVAVVEFRHKSWYVDAVFDMLQRHGAGFCVHDMAGSVSPRLCISGLIYLRFHGATGRYRGSYTDGVLSDWADWVLGQKDVKAIYAYFNNDIEGHAVRNAMSFRAMLDFPGR